MYTFKKKYIYSTLMTGFVVHGHKWRMCLNPITTLIPFGLLIRIFHLTKATTCCVDKQKRDSGVLNIHNPNQVSVRRGPHKKNGIKQVVGHAIQMHKHHITKTVVHG